MFIIWKVSGISEKGSKDNAQERKRDQRLVVVGTWSTRERWKKDNQQKIKKRNAREMGLN